MKVINECSCCGKQEESSHHEKQSAENLPVSWCYITEKACGVHDSDTREFKYEYILCDKCRSEFRKLLKGLK